MAVAVRAPLAAPATTLRAAIYIRVSSVGQEHEGTSLETQEERCRRYAAEHGMAVGATHVYRDVYSGAILHERPQLRDLRTARERVPSTSSSPTPWIDSRGIRPTCTLS